MNYEAKINLVFFYMKIFLVGFIYIFTQQQKNSEKKIGKSKVMVVIRSAIGLHSQKNIYVCLHLSFGPQSLLLSPSWFESSQNEICN